MGLAATAWVPMGAQLPVVSPNDHPNPSQWRPKGPGKSQILKRPKRAHWQAWTLWHQAIIIIIISIVVEVLHRTSLKPLLQHVGASTASHQDIATASGSLLVLLALV